MYSWQPLLNERGAQRLTTHQPILEPLHAATPGKKPGIISMQLGMEMAYPS